ncbi:D-ribose pyranase [Maridesulfovibrio salexigens]|uniref:D-ribose pyranase n=1 Tax=Maridesulfovibrio salexigens (strain ATCC 14822 / DSM 2638 / NCIMB 8403 / VKM B-1763) TaxID=526222 RepID=RBSD_MARSD|nr:D-ribose pyranase [Maridesulfovibrio salexigens]C6BY79.1 RecName: Full=D-ribose pyranase [Maridesulfovibrio salexigens DSM 2638]ACS80609.1 RbsD or FucU transport [Maridesulfovibrio salexigens DSM 2638]
MKRTGLLNSELSYIISKLGHFDALTVCDAGLPIPEGVQRIDLAVSEGIPSFIDVVKAVLMEMELESVELAEEFKDVSSDRHDELISVLEMESAQRGKDIPVDYVRHVNFKLNTKKSVAIVRTGEFTPYANITFKAGVVF